MKRPALYLLLPFCLGIISLRFFPIGPAYPFALSLFSVLIAVIFSNRKRISHFALYLAVFFLGGFCYINSSKLPDSHISNLASSGPVEVILKGVIVDDPSDSAVFDDQNRKSFTLKTDLAKIGKEWHSVCGIVRVDVYSQKDIDLNYGDEAVLEGTLSRPVSLKNPGIFDYADYLGIKGIYAVMRVRDLGIAQAVNRMRSSPIKKISYMLRHKIRDSIDSRLDGPYSGLLKAILIGERSGLSYSVKDDFVKTGTVHILAISGLNVGIIAAVILALFAFLRISRRVGLILTLIAMIFYAFIAGCNPPIVRAVIIFAIFVIGYLLARDTDMINSLSIAAIFMLMWNPKELFDPSFQLSFVSIGSIVVFTPKIDGILHIGSFRKRSAYHSFVRYLLKGVSVSIAAWAGTWPFIAAYFNIISPVSVIANLIAIPLLFVITIAAFVFMIANAFSFFLGGIAAQIVRILEMFLFFVNHRLAVLPMAYFRVGAPSVAISAFYYAFFIPRFKKAALLCLLLYANVIVWWKVCDSAGRDLVVTFFDVGQGDSALVELPGGAKILIDGGTGGSDDKFDSGRHIIAPYLWNRGVSRIDVVIATHLHDDHIGGILYILNNFKVGCVMDNGEYDPVNKIYSEYIDILRDKNIRRLILREGDTVDMTRGAKIFVLNPPSLDGKSDRVSGNDFSLVMKLIYGDCGILFCADATESAITRLNSYENFLRSQILKVPHHGGNLGKRLDIEKFFKNISPMISIISAGENNRYKAPFVETIKAINTSGSICYETKNTGAIKFRIRGKHMTCETCKDKKTNFFMAYLDKV